MMNLAELATEKCESHRKYCDSNILASAYLSSEDMEGMFEKSIGHTYKLITEQLHRANEAKNIKIKVCDGLHFLQVLPVLFVYH
jgi:hypothetical protein